MRFSTVLIITLFLSTHPAYSADLKEDELIAIANEMNKTMPRAVDKITTVNNVKALPGMYLHYIYELDIQSVLVAISQENNLSLEEAENKIISKMGSIERFSQYAVDKNFIQARNLYCSTPVVGDLEPRYLAEKGVTTVHRFYNSNGLFIGSYSFDKDTCN